MSQILISAQPGSGHKDDVCLHAAHSLVGKTVGCATNYETRQEVM